MKAEPIYCKVCGQKLVEVHPHVSYDEFTGVKILGPPKPKRCAHYGCKANARQDYLDELESWDG